MPSGMMAIGLSCLRWAGRVIVAPQRRISSSGCAATTRIESTTGIAHLHHHHPLFVYELAVLRKMLSQPPLELVAVICAIERFILPVIHNALGRRPAHRVHPGTDSARPKIYR